MADNNTSEQKSMSRQLSELVNKLFKEQSKDFDLNKVLTDVLKDSDFSRNTKEGLIRAVESSVKNNNIDRTKTQSEINQEAIKQLEKFKENFNKSIQNFNQGGQTGDYKNDYAGQYAAERTSGLPGPSSADLRSIVKEAREKDPSGGKSKDFAETAIANKLIREGYSPGDIRRILQSGNIEGKSRTNEIAARRKVGEQLQERDKVNELIERINQDTERLSRNKAKQQDADRLAAEQNRDGTELEKRKQEDADRLAEQQSQQERVEKRKQQLEQAKRRNRDQKKQEDADRLAEQQRQQEREQRRRQQLEDAKQREQQEREQEEQQQGEDKLGEPPKAGPIPEVPMPPKPRPTKEKKRESGITPPTASPEQDKLSKEKPLVPEVLPTDDPLIDYIDPNWKDNLPPPPRLAPPPPEVPLSPRKALEESPPDYRRYRPPDYKPGDGDRIVEEFFPPGVEPPPMDPRDLNPSSIPQQKLPGTPLPKPSPDIPRLIPNKPISQFEPDVSDQMMRNIAENTNRTNDNIDQLARQLSELLPLLADSAGGSTVDSSDNSTQNTTTNINNNNSGDSDLARESMFERYKAYNYLNDIGSTRYLT